MELNHKILGSGDPVVILHGLFGMLDNWRSIADKLADTHTVILIDLPNHGRSPRLPVFTLERVAETVKTFLHENWMFRVRIVGHSLGGKVAMAMAQSYPDSVEKLIIVDIGPKKYKPGHNDIFNALRSINFNEHNDRKSIDEELEKSIPNQGTRLFLMKNIKRIPEGFDWKFDLETLYRDYNHIIDSVPFHEQLDIPCLFISGSQSKYIDKDVDQAEITRYFSNNTFKTIEGAGHWVHADKPDEITSTILNFL